MKIVLCQLNPVSGDVAGNTQRIKDTVFKTASEQPDLLVFPEMFILGYPPRDLLEHQWFIAQGLSALDELCAFSQQFPMIGILTGIALPNNLANGRGIYNSAVLIYQGAILFHQNKSLLPTYDVFDEVRYFDPAHEVQIVEFKGEKLGISICEDAWNAEDMWNQRLYEIDPIEKLAHSGATLLINIAASPFHLGKQNLRLSVVQNHALRYGIPFVFVNMTGGNDELIFDGTSMYCDHNGSVCTILPPFKESIATVDTDAICAEKAVPQLDTIKNVHDALVLGIRDYVRKCGFAKLLVGLSGGIDSAVTCALAVKAVGSDNVLGVTMPSLYSSEGSVVDSQQLGHQLGICVEKVPIETIFSTITQAMAPLFNGYEADITEENIQARIRGIILMALSNKFGALLLSTGNKSEMAVGYCTMYGDMSGGLAVLADVYKTKVYELAHYINREKEIIPKAIIDKAPSAELKPDQKDQDSLPPYDILDTILLELIEHGKSTSDVIAQGFERQTVEWIVRAVINNEYKRRQAPPGLKITEKAFGSGRRFPIAARYTR